MKAFMSGLGRFAASEIGVTSIEYALLAALIAVICVAAIVAVGANLSALYLTVCGALGGC